MLQQLSKVEKQKRFYSEIGEKFGNQMRNQLIRQNKTPNRAVFKTFSITQIASLPTRYKPKVSHSSIMSSQDLKSKEKDVRTFKQKLKRNLEDSRELREVKNHELSNKVRWRKSLMSHSRREKLEQFHEHKKKEVRVLKNILVRDEQAQRLKSRQIQLQNAFTCLERRLKTLKESGK